MGNIITPILFAVVAVGLAFTYINPSYNTLLALRVLDTRLQEAFTDFEKLKNEQDGLLEAYNRFSAEDMMHLEQILPDELDTMAVVVDVNAMALEAGLIVTHLDVNDMHQETNSAPQELMQETELGIDSGLLHVTVRGSYESLKSFLRTVESSLTVLDVVALNINARNADEYVETGTYEYTVTIQKYWLQ